MYVVTAEAFVTISMHYVHMWYVHVGECTHACVCVDIVDAHVCVLYAQ